MSSNLTAESSTVNTFDIRGIPAKCVCGTATTIFTADTVKNPGRPFYRCLTRRKIHYFPSSISLVVHVWLVPISLTLVAVSTLVVVLILVAVLTLVAGFVVMMMHETVPGLVVMMMH
ncbi:hypothetical protein HID58_080703 [Brassica napus]|uniref:Zinc finger GRF-type domain-containing protein n=1 Tax=Brassica napus TaxID=3708 RepID=A0ABQ7Y5M0_BRANA|nr:hypothetical protein HID58_080703 [Brassica napus]